MEKQQVAYSQSEILKQLLPLVHEQGHRYRKQRNVYARVARRAQQIETVTSDGKETVNRARRGDFIIRSQTGAHETYVLPPQKFQSRYERIGEWKNGYDEYRPVGRIMAVELDTKVMNKLGVYGSFSFVAPWGEPMIAKSGDFLACPTDCSEVYRIARKEFFETYVEE